MINRFFKTRRVTGGVWMLAAVALVAASGPQAAAAADAPAAASGAPPAGRYQLDKSHASLLFRVSHLGFSNYTTRFSRFDAQLTFDPAKLVASQVVVTIDATSLEMDGAPQACLDIVRGPQMLDTAKFPEMIYKSERVQVKGSNSMEIIGKLTLHGVTRALVLNATYNGGYAGHPMDPHARVGFSAHASLKRSDFGIAFGIPAAGSTMGVGDPIDISIEAEFSGPALPTTNPK
ncbi:MAG: polyisoprenoid-binding protein [Gammaproteobacteria bacterium]|nr:MAG: polyisoprenoid-binding protein [Gammaproteobacteria bacterium]